MGLLVDGVWVDRRYRSHGSINPTRVVPLGPPLDPDEPHERGRIGPGLSQGVAVV